VLSDSVWGDNTWPSPTAVGVNPAEPGAEREYARALYTHITEHADFTDHEERIYTALGQDVPYTWGHDEFIWRLAGRFFLGYDVDLQGGEAVVDRNRTITANVVAAGGDFSQVPETWTTEWTPFMWAHWCLALIAYYEDDAFTGGQHHANIKALIPQAVYDMCDAAIAHFGVLDGDGRMSRMIYRIPEGGLEPAEGWASLANADLSLWLAFMFAWSYSKTGNQQHYQVCVDLIRGGLQGAWLVWGKRINQSCITAWMTFQLLGWTTESFKLPWKYDIAGGEQWPS
jgi:hypothetical protein